MKQNNNNDDNISNPNTIKTWTSMNTNQKKWSIDFILVPVHEMINAHDQNDHQSGHDPRQEARVP
jgi:hypothetical protein